MRVSPGCSVCSIGIPQRKKRQQNGEIKRKFRTGKYEFPDKMTYADTKEDPYIKHNITNF